MIELTKYTKETYTLPDGRDVIKEVTIFSDGHAVIMESKVSPEIDQMTRDQMDVDRSDFIRMYDFGRRKSNIHEDGLELIEEAINLDDLCNLLGIQWMIKHTEHYAIEIGGYLDKTGWMIAFSATNEAIIIYVKQGLVVYEEDIELLPHQAVSVSIDYGYKDKEELCN